MDAYEFLIGVLGVGSYMRTLIFFLNKALIELFRMRIYPKIISSK